MDLILEAFMLNNFSRGAIVAAALLSAPVFAGQIDDVQSVQIRFDDLNLTSPSGRAALTARVAQAADAFCQKPSDTRDLAARSQFQDCRKQAMLSADAQIRRAVGAATGSSLLAQNDL